MKRSKGSIISIVNTKGGSCKTTTVVNIAADLRRRGFKVLIIDNDPQGTASKFFGILNTNDMATMYDTYFTQDITAEELIVHTDRGDIMPSDAQLKNANFFENAMLFLKPKKILRDYCLKNYDFTIIDTQGAPGIPVTASLTMSDYVIIPTVPSKSNLFEVGGTISAINEVRDNVNPLLKYLGVIICNGKTTGVVTKSARDFLEQTINQGTDSFIYSTLVRQSVDVVAAECNDIDINEYLENDEVKINGCKFSKINSNDMKKMDALSDKARATFLFSKLKIAKKTQGNIKLLPSIGGYQVEYSVNGVNGVKIVNGILTIPETVEKGTITLGVDLHVNSLIESKSYEIKIIKDNVGFDYKKIVLEMLERIGE